MFKKEKQSNLEGVHHWPGIYKFELPYLIGDNVPNEEGLIKVYTCDVEMHIGGQNNLDQGLIASIIISAQQGGAGTTNFIEDIATLVKTGYIDEVVLPSFGPIHDRIRWIERNYYPKENYQVVTMEWDIKDNSYSSPKWSNLQEDWILQQTTLQPYI